MDEFGARLKAERKRLGLKSAELAQLGKVGTAAQSNYERGVRRPDSVYLAAIADAGVDVSYVVTGQRSAEMVLSLEEQAMLAAYRQAPAAVKAAALAVLAGTRQQRPLVGKLHTEAGGKSVIVAGDVNGDFSI